VLGAYGALVLRDREHRIDRDPNLYAWHRVCMPPWVRMTITAQADRLVLFVAVVTSLCRVDEGLSQISAPARGATI
jgi:hypothetical protein